MIKYDIGLLCRRKNTLKKEIQKVDIIVKGMKVSKDLFTNSILKFNLGVLLKEKYRMIAAIQNINRKIKDRVQNSNSICDLKEDFYTEAERAEILKVVSYIDTEIRDTCGAIEVINYVWEGEDRIYGYLESDRKVLLWERGFLTFINI